MWATFSPIVNLFLLSTRTLDLQQLVLLLLLVAGAAAFAGALVVPNRRICPAAWEERPTSEEHP